MPSGGARTTSGPPPDPNALRRGNPSDQATWTVLPAEGYQGAIPPWPLSRLTEREQEVWQSVWCKPQAVMWARHSQELEVAMFVRNLVNAEGPRAPAILQPVVLRYFDSLGLSTAGMLRHRWKIGADPQPERTVTTKARNSARDRFKVVDPAG
ncbi:MAG: hypothetical protein ACRDRO_16430 [Pseudonocardiaceae bacterium]